MPAVPAPRPPCLAAGAGTRTGTSGGAVLIVQGEALERSLLDHIENEGSVSAGTVCSSSSGSATAAAAAAEPQVIAAPPRPQAGCSCTAPAETVRKFRPARFLYAAPLAEWLCVVLLVAFLFAAFKLHAGSDDEAAAGSQS